MRGPKNLAHTYGRAPEGKDRAILTRQHAIDRCLILLEDQSAYPGGSGWGFSISAFKKLDFT
jgi:hypothetical protein